MLSSGLAEALAFVGRTAERAPLRVALKRGAKRFSIDHAVLRDAWRQRSADTNAQG